MIIYRLFAIFYTVIYYYFAPFIVTGLVILSQILANETEAEKLEEGLSYVGGDVTAA